VFGDNFALAAVVIGLIMPPEIEGINRPDWPREVKAISAFGLRVPGSWLARYIVGQSNVTSFDERLRTILIVIFVAILTHRCLPN
jgi:hypothetical protein